jgi:uncharacterized protein (TIGR02217 family)
MRDRADHVRRPSDQRSGVVTAGFQFDTPVRFDTDRIEVTLESFGAGRMVGHAPLIEVRV